MFGGLSNLFGGLFGGSGRPAGVRSPMLPAAATNNDVTRAFASQNNPAQDRIISDITNVPWRGPGDFDRDGHETDRKQLEYRRFFRQEPAVRAAVRGKTNAVASLDLAVIPAGKSKLDAFIAEFLKFAIESSEHGAHGLVRNIVQPAIIDGWSLSETKLEVVRQGKWRNWWGLAHCRQLDTLHMRLQLDQFRNVTGVVNLTAGVQVYEPEKTLLFTYSGMHSNPFGQSDIRACYRAAGLIEDAYKAWYVAIQRFGIPYMHGKFSAATNKQALEEALQDLIAGGYVVTDAESAIEIVNLAAAASFQAFESKVNKLREEIFLAVRGAYLPFLEGQGGTDSHGDTAVHKVASDSDEYLLAKDAALVINRQLVPVIVRANFGHDVDLPRVVIAGTNWAETAAQLKVGAMLLKDFKLPLSRDHVYEISQFAPPNGPEDVVKPEEAPQAGGMPGGAAPGAAPPDALAGAAPPEPTPDAAAEQPKQPQTASMPQNFADKTEIDPAQVARCLDKLLNEMGLSA